MTVLKFAKWDRNLLVGTSPELLEHLLEIRGLGIINVTTLFGAGAVRSHKKITLCVHLELWDKDKHYDRVGTDEEKMKIIDFGYYQVDCACSPR